MAKTKRNKPIPITAPVTQPEQPQGLPIDKLFAALGITQFNLTLCQEELGKTQNALMAAQQKIIELEAQLTGPTE